MHICVVGRCHWNAGREELDWRVVGGVTDAMCADYTDYYTILYVAMGGWSGRRTSLAKDSWVHDDGTSKAAALWVEGELTERIDGRKMESGWGWCHPHRRKHCMAATLQMAVFPAHQLRFQQREKGRHAVDVHTAEVG